MASWNELLNEFAALPIENRSQWGRDQQLAALRAIAKQRGGRHVVFYGSAFLQKPRAPFERLSIVHEDLNAYMSVIHGMDWSRNLTLVLHTPGGLPQAAETTVAYLRSKFADIEVIVPTLAMSAGTMISLAANRIIMGRQSQLGPIDPQFNIGLTPVSAQAIVDQFEEAKQDIVGDQRLAHAWAPIVQSMGPALLQTAKNALAYGESMVAQWLQQYMFAGDPSAAQLARDAASHFNTAQTHKSHGRRIDREEVRSQNIVVEDLETDQDLQDAVLTLYHLASILFDHGSAVKLLISDTDRAFVKNWTQKT